MADVSVVGLHVRTESGHSLGRVSNVILDDATQGIRQFEVRSTRLPGVGQTYCIALQQVQKISAEEIVVDDASAPQATPQLATTT
jgi:sporulation protein YlmC with PRC-barrel domain